MPLATNQPRCDVCASKLVKNGTTSSGRTRWRCKHCGASSTQSREDITRRNQLTRFVAWLLSRFTQADHGGTGRTFRAATLWCWSVRVPHPEPTGVVHEQLMLDGTYFNGWCVIIAYTRTHVVDWQFCDRENQAGYETLLRRIPAPRMVIIDGHHAALAAIKNLWPDTLVQRCLFHVFQVIRRHQTFNPRLEAGKEILELTKALMRVDNLDQASAWISEYTEWEARWDTFLKHRSSTRNGDSRPSSVPVGRQWWYTHQKLRRSRGLFRTLLRKQHLFTWLNPTLARADGTPPDRTTSPLEGGPNAAIKRLLRDHRGLSRAHARRAVEWLLDSLTDHPRDPWTLTKPEHYTPPKASHRTKPTTQERIGPATYDTAFSPEDGNGVQHGWAGRSHP